LRDCGEGDSYLIVQQEAKVVNAKSPSAASYVQMWIVESGMAVGSGPFAE
jgi:hypothetical protein